MRFDILTTFPHIFDSYLNESMIKRGQAKGLIQIRIHDIRKFTRNKHRRVDDRPYGGGPGMVIKLEPLVRTISSLKLKTSAYGGSASGRKNRKLKIILFSASGKQFNANMARRWAGKYDRIIMIAGRYEGVDERVFNVLQATRYKLQAISIGPYVITGGELPALVVVDAISRHIPGFLGKVASLEENRFGVGVPAYTRPDVFLWKRKKYCVPKILLEGDHQRIDAWRKKKSKSRSREQRSS